MKTHVDNDDVRSRTDGKCFYCFEPIGQEHTWKCVIPNKEVKILAVIEFNAKVPRSWTKDEIEFRYELGSYCNTNALREIEDWLDQNDTCLCSEGKFKVLDMLDTPEGK